MLRKTYPQGQTIEANYCVFLHKSDQILREIDHGALRSFGTCLGTPPATYSDFNLKIIYESFWRGPINDPLPMALPLINLQSWASLRSELQIRQYLQSGLRVVGFPAFMTTASLLARSDIMMSACIGQHAR